ncbi:MAG: hypothetical protein JNG89_10000 [Planctomycetaceae bacterium]|nr:hypothetical protein [Planctomycetaceae bacterium]
MISAADHPDVDILREISGALVSQIKDGEERTGRRCCKAGDPRSMHAVFLVLAKDSSSDPRINGGVGVRIGAHDDCRHDQQAQRGRDKSVHEVENVSHWGAKRRSFAVTIADYGSGMQFRDRFSSSPGGNQSTFSLHCRGVGADDGSEN